MLVTTPIFQQTLTHIYNKAEIIHTHATQKKKLKISVEQTVCTDGPKVRY
jgi:hypothetical protein